MVVNTCPTTWHYTATEKGKAVRCADPGDPLGPESPRESQGALQGGPPAARHGSGAAAGSTQGVPYLYEHLR